jgi:hypothetical protein
MTTTNGVHHATDEAIDQLYAWMPADVVPAPLPEAPASVNVRVLLAGHEVQLTLRGTDEGQVLQRLQEALARPDVRPLPKPAPKAGAWRKGH